MSTAANEQLNRIRFLLTDVDGVLTDGQLYFDHEGNESKVFHVHDGAAFAYWRRAGFKSGFVSGRECPAVLHRAKALHIDEIHLGHLDKLPVVQSIAIRHGLEFDEIAYVGDDLLDLPVLAEVGFSASVSNGRPEVRDRVHYVTETPGGRGAIREVIEFILKAKGLWDNVVDSDGRP
jgi:3-deoxy-D-manno-octulosonate 8-phosphate phosphatase (KDO 8-P phosphatase)